jgi:hypothetical protein
MDNETRVAHLVRAANSVLRAFRAGNAPTYDMLDRLEGALYPFVEDKICGHRIVEECHWNAIGMPLECHCFERMTAHDLANPAKSSPAESRKFPLQDGE